MNRVLLIFILGLLSAISAYSRETVKGTVVDSKGVPVPGVKVEIPGSSEFTFTDLDGAFQITLRDPVKSLNFTYPGFGTISRRVQPEMAVMLGKGWDGNAKGFRGMVDLEGGMGVKGNVTIKSGNTELRNIHTFLMTSPTVTLGYQLNRHLFIGAGTGAYLDITKCEYNRYSEYYTLIKVTGINIPLFLAARWDFGLSKKTAPYVGLRVGYSRFFTINNGYIGESYNYSGRASTEVDVYRENSGAAFITPFIGYRMTIYNKLGINIGLSYMAMTNSKMYASLCHTYRPGQNQDYIFSQSESFFTQRATDMIFFNIGFDF